jgi:DNA-binding NtrC family response regulator
MKHPTLDYQGLEDILALVPEGTPWFYLLYTYILVTLKKNNGNRTHTSKKLKIPLRTLRCKFQVMETLGYVIPPYEKKVS